MMRPGLFFLVFALALPGDAQTLTRQNLATILGFENNTRAGIFPSGWGGSPLNTVFVDDQVFHSGKYSARLERDASSAGTFTTITLVLPLDFSGQTIEWRGFFKMENVSDYAALWMRIDGSGGTVAFNSLQSQALKGTTDWKEYAITLPNAAAGQQLFVGFLAAGTGKAWVDDLQLLVDGKPVAQAAPRVPSAFDNDHEFDTGSRISLNELSDQQVGNLAKLAKVWGFLKYHHPAVAGGNHHWDYELFRILSSVLAATDGTAANSAMRDWIAALEPVTDCTKCATLPLDGLYMGPDLDWISDESALGPDLSQILQAIYRNRPTGAKQFYVEITTGTGNPLFANELTYANLRVPDAGYQLLALFRSWNMVQYFYPNRDVMTDDPTTPGYWDSVLQESIPAMALAKTTLAYQQEMIRFIAKINDTHANLWSSLSARPPLGACYLPVDVRFVEGSAYVIRQTSLSAAPASGLQAGDVIRQLDGVAVEDLAAQWRPMYADSNTAARMRDIGNYLTRGACGPVSVTVGRGDSNINISTTRVATSAISFAATYTHDLPGPVFQKLSSDIAYLKLSTVKASDSASYIRSAAGTKGLIIDIRNYPSEFVVFTLGSLLVSQRTDFARFTFADPVNPGAFRWGTPVSLSPQQPHYDGKIVILVDEVSQSQAEYTSMAFRSAPGAIVIGSTTAGADGDVSTINLPGGLSSYISGIGVFYPDMSPTQRVGIVTDIEIRPTLAGLRAGRDELIEEAMRQITGQ